MLDAIRQRFESRGWEILEVRKVRYLWVAEIWKARSTWSPTDLVVYLLFAVDPHDGPQEFEKIRLLYALPRPPVDWAQDPEDRDGGKQRPEILDGSTIIGKGQDKYFGEFLDAIDRWRDAAARLESD